MNKYLSIGFVLPCVMFAAIFFGILTIQVGRCCNIIECTTAGKFNSLEVSGRLIFPKVQEGFLGLSRNCRLFCKLMASAAFVF